MERMQPETMDEIKKIKSELATLEKHVDRTEIDKKVDNLY